MKERPTEEELVRLYLEDRISPERIGEMFGLSGRSIRSIMSEYGIPRLGPSHLRKGKSATWNKGLIRSEEAKERNRIAHTGKAPHNKGQGRIHFNCIVCGAEVFDKPYRKKRTCSSKCKDIFMASIGGEKHWNYKGEQAGFRQRQRNWAQYRSWRRAVLKRDCYKCVKCSKSGGRLTAHHLDSFAEHEAQRFSLQKGATLCWSCHWAFHRTYGHKMTTKDQFEQWLTTS